MDVVCMAFFLRYNFILDYLHVSNVTGCIVPYFVPVTFLSVFILQIQKFIVIVE